MRSGLINLFKYENQVFPFEDGHLLLRGDNGSGKSRVLALQLPFLLDGEMSPHRVEPDRDRAKRMEWNLLMDQHDRRTGYTWIEFGRRDSETKEEWFLTLGCGMDARKGDGAPKRWFFIAKGRLGRDFEVVEGKQPLSERQLEAAFAESGIESTVYRRTQEYRAAVNDALFQLGSRYEPLLDLLIQLRQPQLMRDMKEEALSAALSEALPPLADSLIAEVAESFQGLESDRQKTDDHRSMLEHVESFRDGYRQYLAVAVRRLCEVVRNRHSQFEAATKAARKIETELEESATRKENAATLVAEKSSRLSDLSAELDALRSSPEMREKENLDQTRQRAEELAQEANEAERVLGNLERRLQEERADRERRERKTEQIRTDLDHAHQSLRPKWEKISGETASSLFDWSESNLTENRKALEEWLTQRGKNVEHLQTRNAEIEQETRHWDQTREALELARTARDESETEVNDRDEALVKEIEDFGEAVHRWERGLTLLDPAVFPRGEEWAEHLSHWLDGKFNRVESETQQGRVADTTLSDRFDLWEKVSEARVRVVERISRDEAETAQQQKFLHEDRVDLVVELDALRAGRQPEPPLPHTRGATVRADRIGFPFWREVEFHDGIPESERAGWEAALEGSGLLDAWVAQDGSVVRFENDDFLRIGEELELPEEESLAAILCPASGMGELTGLLRRIGNHSGAGRCWVDQSGHWANGIHRGHFAKSSADYLGAAAREAARQRRITELEDEIARLDEELEQLDRELVGLTEERKTLAEEVRSAPTITAAESAAGDLDHARSAWRRAEQLLILAEKNEKAARQKTHEVIARRDADAADFQLADHAEPDALLKYQRGLTDFRDATNQFWPRWQRFLDHSEELTHAREREARTKRESEEADVRVREKGRVAQEARTRWETLSETVGSTVEELMKRIESAQRDAHEVKRELTNAEGEVRDSEIEEAGLKANLENAVEKRSSAEEDRNHAIQRMEAFVEARLFEEIEPGYQPDRTDFSATAAVELARRMEKELKEDSSLADEQWGKLQSGIQQSFGEFVDQMGRHGYNAILDFIDDGQVAVIRCDYQANSRTVGELRDFLDKELADRRRFFEEKEREIIENHLIGEAAHELQRLIREGEQSVLKMNEEMSKVRTSSGMQIRFRWMLEDTADETLEKVRKVFLKTSRTWSEAERDEIGGFLQERIQSEREADDTVSWREHLSRALDYRSWHRFSIERRTGGGSHPWKRLTKRTFGTGSGGEKAVTLTLPQFAAAAAHYRSAHPHAPRLILLDEVFVGIDDRSRELLMELLETFDLDYVMTSQEMWGTFRAVTALSICHLVTRTGFNAVAVTRWIWNGQEKVRVEDRA